MQPNLHLPIWAWARRDVIEALHQVRRTLAATAGVVVLAMAMDPLSWSLRMDLLALVLVALAKNRLILGAII